MEEGPPKARDLIRSSFSSRVAVLCSSNAESTIKQFNLNLRQLVQPFAKLTTEATWQDPSGQLIVPKDLHLTLVDIGGSWKKPEVDTQRNRRLLTNVVTQSPPPFSSSFGSTTTAGFNTVSLAGKSMEYEVSLPATTGWFESWRKMFLKMQSDIYGSQHEFLYHFVACVLVISAAEVKTSEDIANAVGKLSKIQQQHQYDHPNTWILPSVLKYYLIVQDSQMKETEAEQVYQNFRTMYGGNFCHLLKFAGEEAEAPVPNPWKCQIEGESFLADTSKIDEEAVDGKVLNIGDDQNVIVQSDLVHPLSPDCEKPPITVQHNGEISSNGMKYTDAIEYGASLTCQDIQRIQLTVNEFISKALLPYMERQCRNLHESILNRRGMSKSFFSATKRLFGTASKSTPSIVYASESVEILSRKLADIYFLFGHYGGAYHLYHQLKKDFYGDAAWLYYSSALELAAMSHFMMSQSEPPLAVARAFPAHYVNDAIGHYIDQCRMVDAATRCAVLCAECLKQLENYSECAAIFIRMTSEDCDLRSALMLEQASYCFLEMKSPRKYALHSVLAGYRYAKAGLKNHSLNSYQQGYQIYNRKGWRYAEDHVNFTIARLQNILQIPEGIEKHLLSTLVSPSPQPSHQIQSFYKEFLQTMNTLKSNTSNVPFHFFVPEVKFVDMQIRIAVTDLPVGECETVILTESTSASASWNSLEESIVRECVNHSVIAFKPTRLLFSRSLDNTVHPTVPCEEEFYIELPIFNPLKIGLSLRNITLKFDRGSEIIVNSIPHLELDPEATKVMRFSITSCCTGMIVFEAVQYELELSGSSVLFQQNVNLKGLRLNTTNAERCGKIYSKDLRNQIEVINKLPLLQARVSGLPETFFHAQTANFQIVLQDKSKSIPSSMTVTKVIVAATDMDKNLQVLPVPSGDNNNSLILHATRKNYTQLHCESSTQITSIPCVFKAPPSGDTAVLDILILYEIINRADALKRSHRVIRVTIKAPISPAVHLEYSSLKMSDCFSYMGLLRLYNLTVDFNIKVNKIFFTPSDYTVTNVCTASIAEGVQQDCKEAEVVMMKKNESKNIVLRFKNVGNNMKNSDVNINVQWQIENSDLGILAVGHSQMRINEALASIESSFIFQVQHPNAVFSDFENSPLCLCNVELKVHSRVGGRFSIELEANPPSDDLTATGPSLRASGDIFISGKKVWKLQLETLTTEVVTYTLAVAWPGVYNAAPKIVVTDEERSVQETYSLHSPIIIAHRLM